MDEGLAHLLGGEVTQRLSDLGFGEVIIPDPERGGGVGPGGIAELPFYGAGIGGSAEAVGGEEEQSQCEGQEGAGARRSEDPPGPGEKLESENVRMHGEYGLKSDGGEYLRESDGAASSFWAVGWLGIRRSMLGWGGYWAGAGFVVVAVSGRVGEREWGVRALALTGFGIHG
jgi:hypothetical protein